MRKRISLMLSFVSLIAIVSTAIGVTRVYYTLFQTQVRNGLDQSAHILLESELFDTYSEENIRRLSELDFENLRITWIEGDGKVLFDNDKSADGLDNHRNRPEFKDAKQFGQAQSKRHSDTMDMDTFYYALLLDNGSVLRVSTQARNMTSVFVTALPIIFVIAVFILLSCLIIGQILIRKLLNPIEEMAEHLDDSGSVSVYKELEPFRNMIRSQHEKILLAAKNRQEFTANVSHELKTPITSISGYAELIANRLVEREAEEDIARKIMQNSERLLSLVNDIIQLSEFDHGRSSKNFEFVDLKSIATDCTNANFAFARKRLVHLSCRGISAGISADRSLIFELIDNLIQNAIRYNRENGRVEVIVTIEEEHPILIVKDTGIGIPPEHQERVFERFYRVDKSRSRATGGTGLGLAIVKHIADIHSADIELFSEVDKGTIIKVIFHQSFSIKKELSSGR